MIVNLTDGSIAFVDAEDYERVVEAGPWHLQNRGYAHRNVRRPDGSRTTQLLHRFIMGVTDPSLECDHINSNKLDNRRANLRLVDSRANKQNTRKRAGCSSTLKGVYNRGESRWAAQIRSGGQNRFLGTFTNEEEAGHAYDEAARRYFGQYARVNFALPNEQAASN